MDVVVVENMLPPNSAGSAGSFAATGKASERGSEKGTGQRRGGSGSVGDKESLVTSRFWERTEVGRMIRYSIFPATQHFFNPSFADPVAEKHYQKEVSRPVARCENAVAAPC